MAEAEELSLSVGSRRRAAGDGMADPTPEESRGWAVRLAGAVLLLVLGIGVGVVAGRTAFAPPSDPLEEAPPLTYIAHEETIGRTVNFTAIAEWPSRVIASLPVGGTVTQVMTEPGELVEQGDVAYSIDLRPATLAHGQVPMFRSLEFGVEGADVEQLQRFLTSLELYAGPVDGRFAESTRDAVRRWQRDVGVPVTGQVLPLDLVFVPQLPLRVALGDELRVGSHVAPGSPALLALQDRPAFSIPLDPSQRDLVPLDAAVVVHYPEGSWSGLVQRAVERPTGGGLHLELAGPDGTPLCKSECRRWIGSSGRTNFEAEVVLVPEVKGVVAPVAALMQRSDNSLFVRRADGREISVDVIASSGGLVVVDGLEAGTEIVLPDLAPAASEGRS